VLLLRALSLTDLNSGPVCAEFEHSTPVFMELSLGKFRLLYPGHMIIRYEIASLHLYYSR
jgi:hypothetical protein